MGLISDLLAGIPVNPVLRERLALADSKAAVLVDERDKLRVDVEEVTAKNLALESENRQLRKDNEILRNRINQLEQDLHGGPQVKATYQDVLRG